MRQDPTRTRVLRSRYESAIGGRLRRVSSLNRISIVDNDAFALSGGVILLTDQPAAPGQFSGSATEKIERYESWLRQVFNTILLAGATATTLGRQWFTRPIQEAYTRAVRRADRLLGSPQPPPLRSVISTSLHDEALAFLQARNFNELKGLSEVAAQQLSREIAEAFTQGLAPRAMARRISSRIGQIRRTRAKVIARTEVIRAYAEATLNRFEQAGVRFVEADIEVQIATAPGRCPRCAALEPRRFSIEEARGVIPVHPNCRCAWVIAAGERRLPIAA